MLSVVMRAAVIRESFMSKLILRFLTNESGTTAIEYALMAGSIAVVIIGTVNTVGSQLTATFYTKISAAFK
jgi:pilus assembly protein Flp/PilA